MSSSEDEFCEFTTAAPKLPTVAEMSDPSYEKSLLDRLFPLKPGEEDYDLTIPPDAANLKYQYVKPEGTGKQQLIELVSTRFRPAVSALEESLGCKLTPSPKPLKAKEDNPRLLPQSLLEN